MTEQHNETIVIMGGHYWGSGDSLAEAKTNYRRQGGRLGDRHIVLTFDASTEFLGVDRMGRYSWNGNEPTLVEVAGRGPRS